MFLQRFHIVNQAILAEGDLFSSFAPSIEVLVTSNRHVQVQAYLRGMGEVGVAAKSGNNTEWPPQQI